MAADQTAFPSAVGAGMSARRLTPSHLHGSRSDTTDDVRPGMSTPQPPSDEGQPRPRSTGCSTPSLTDILGSIGLPRPAALAETDKAEMREGRQFDSLIGSLTHQLIGRLVPFTREATSSEIGRLVAEHLAEAVPADRRLGNIQAARSRVAGMACLYLQQVAPGPHVQFLGAEVVADTGRIDLAWKCPTLGVFFDELKTWRHVLGTLDGATVQQVMRYRAFGAERFGARFAGIRLLPLGALPQGLWFTPDGLSQRLADSPAAPAALRTRTAA